MPTEPKRPLTLFTTPIAFSKTRASHACSPLGPHHTNRPALLRCYINRVTSPLLLPSFLGPPNGRRLMSTRNFGPTFSSASSRPNAAPKKHLLQHTGPQWGPLPSALLPPSPSNRSIRAPETPQVNKKLCRKLHQENQPCVLAWGNKPPCSMNRVVAMRGGSAWLRHLWTVSSPKELPKEFRPAKMWPCFLGGACQTFTRNKNLQSSCWFYWSTELDKEGVFATKITSI